MEALLIIVGLIIGIFIILTIGVIIREALAYLLLWLILLWPWIIGIPIGILVWSSGNKIIGNILVIVNFILGFVYGGHFQKEGCNCLLHKTIARLQGIIDDSSIF